MNRKDKKRKTKISEEGLYKLWSKGCSDHEIARILGFSQTGISRARQRLNLKPNFDNPMGDDDRSPEEIYSDSKANARKWKKRNPLRVKEHFSAWQKENRTRLSAYMWLWRNKFI